MNERELDKRSSAMHGNEHGGNVHKLLRDGIVGEGRYIDFSANINPLGPPAWLRAQINRSLEMILHYPDPDSVQLIETISSVYRVKPEFIVAGNGSTELLHFLPDILENKKVIIPVPCYIDYLTVFQKNGFQVELLSLDEKEGFRIEPERLDDILTGGDIVLLGNPANPTGISVADSSILELAGKHPETIFVVDEAFHDFIEDHSTVGGKVDNIITLNSLTKFYSVPGLRIGFGIFPERYASLMREKVPQWSLNTLAQGVAGRALLDNEYARRSRLYCNEMRNGLKAALKTIDGLKVFESEANYLLLKAPRNMSAESLYRNLLSEGIVIRRCGNYEGLDNTFFRVAVRTEEENRRLVHSLKNILDKKASRRKNRARKTKSLMFQGTSSNAGKSILAAAFCRIFLQDGFKVAPFKAQNMSLNSHVTHDGGEMGRAQVVQAMAARVDPDYRMNPVLLKPNSDTGSQVILNGRPVGNMNVRQYHCYKDEAWKAAVESFNELSQQYEVIVLEGAGSPGEINLKQHDFVNMKMARYAESPVLLVGDIDRGGVYASFAGIMDVLEEWERKMIAGFVVNKFRGDQSLLDEAHRFIKDHTGKEVFAVIPYISDMSIPQEDSVSLRDGFYHRRGSSDAEIDIVVVDIPHISNFTDIDPLYHEPDVSLRFVSYPDELGSPDAIILPGSKNVAGDLDFLRKRGFDQKLLEFADQGGMIIGICGGYQMLGRTMKDPYQIETSDGEVAGIGLISVDTVLEPEKTLKKKKGIHIESGLPVEGYEIHHGITGGELTPVLQFDDSGTCGSRNGDGTVWGAYLHGIFDRDEFRRWFVDSLRSKKSIPVVGKVIAPYDLDRGLDELAEVVRGCFDMSRIYKLLGL